MIRQSGTVSSNASHRHDVYSIVWSYVTSIFRGLLLVKFITLLGDIGHAAGGAVGWGTALQVGRSQVRFPMVSLVFFFDLIFPAANGPGVDSASNRNEYQEYFLDVKKAGA
jgi:hypothetical protein